MIKPDADIWGAVVREGLARHGTDPSGDLAVLDVGAIMRGLGLKGIRLSDGSRALGSPYGDGSWFVLQTADRDIIPTSRSRREPDWHAGRLEEATGSGFMTSEPRRLHEAVTQMIRMPSPVMADGEVLDARVSGFEEALAIQEEALARGPVPAPAM